eukprot:7437891-Pyramimonas_sp.AAC.1
MSHGLADIHKRPTLLDDQMHEAHNTVDGTWRELARDHGLAQRIPLSSDFVRGDVLQQQVHDTVE